MVQEQLNSIAAQFALDAKVVKVATFGNGLINDSYFVETTGNAPDYLLQRINHKIFTNVEMLQNNIITVTNHIREKLLAQGVADLDRRVLRIIPARDGKTYYFDGTNYWRMLLFIPRSTSYEQITPQYAGYAGRAFGEFQSMLADLKEPIGEIIPNFHNMSFRWQQLQDAAAKDAANRFKDTKWLYDELENNRKFVGSTEWLSDRGMYFPKRLCHCDTKVNNILFDKDTNEILCVIDLDTVMPNLIYSDYGDFMRTAANTGAEDDQNLDNITYNMDIFRAFTKEYVAAAKSFLTNIELHNLPYGAFYMTYMQCVRFYTDYLNGDTYYKIKYSDHNLVRAKAQWKLCCNIDEHTTETSRYVDSLL